MHSKEQQTNASANVPIIYWSRAGRMPGSSCVVRMLLLDGGMPWTQPSILLLSSLNGHGATKRPDWTCWRIASKPGHQVHPSVRLPAVAGATPPGGGVDIHDSAFMFICSPCIKSSCHEQNYIPLHSQVAVYLEDLRSVNAVCMR